jgi:phenylacetate-CoA ligase
MLNQPQVTETQLAHAVEQARLAVTTPAYAGEWGAQRGDVSVDNWADLPFLSKERMIEAAAAAPPFGGRLTVAQEQLGWVFVAPGPIYMPYTADDMTRVTAAYAVALESLGLTRADLVDQTLLYNWVIAATMVDRGLSTLGCGIVPGGPGNTEQHAEALVTAGVTAVIAMPSFLETLLTAVGDRPHSLRKAVIMGELSDAGAKGRIAAASGVVVREFYGVGDVGAVAYECAAGEGMHLRPDLLVEFIDPESGAHRIPDKGSPAEIVVTDFARRAMPIVRLRSGDLVDELITELCSCGNPAPRIRRIVGRSNDITKVRGMFVVPGEVSRVLRNRGVSAEHCLVVDRHEGRDTLQVLIEGTADAGVDELQREIERVLRIRADLRFVDRLPEGSGLLRDRRQFQAG